MNPQLLEQSEATVLTEIDKIRQQFDHAPYPRVPLDLSPQSHVSDLYLHNLVTSYYLKYRQVIQTEGKVILDAGCGSGYKSLMLAIANPGAKIVGIDLSDGSVQLARQRIQHHNLPNCEFHTLLIDDLPQLGLEFDYINCDEVLYLIPDPVAALQSFKAVLKPQGIIRANLHSAYQRADYFRAQALFKLLGLMDESPKDLEHEMVVATMNALIDTANLKMSTWSPSIANPATRDEQIAANHLLVGDRGFIIPEMFEMLRASRLEFLSMVEWRSWDIVELFKDPDNLPDLWNMSLAYASPEEKLRLFELIHPVHRLLDFWCTHDDSDNGLSVDDWSDEDWHHATVNLHPQLCTEEVRAEAVNCIEQGQGFEISRTIRVVALGPIILDGSLTACLLPLWEGAQPIQALVDRYRQIRPVNPVTLEPVSQTDAFQAVKQCLNRLDAFLYVLLDKG
ncbi:MAG: class I SAM-dependent methyltransferase [Oculatellaceae cyanobacterium Prado106]|jgi:2-polyprenyl-3-methyl-5-hydroxy-6-metoxy-1,4-benzoquinol methylase|nr:class I SAM-dependent methyltransferase [Oculatellaceae cyanobacterium Prado106]